MASEPCVPEPDETKVQAIVSTICEEGLDAERVETVVLQVLRSQFSRSVGRLQRMGYGQPVWTGNAKTTRIYISAFHAYNKDDAQRLPKILIEERDASIGRQHIGGGLVRIDVRTGKEVYLETETGLMAVYCVASVPNEARLIGQEARDTLRQWAPILRRTLGFSRFEVSQLGKLGRVQEGGELRYSRPFSVSWEAPYAFEIEPEAPETQRIVYRRT